MKTKRELQQDKKRKEFWAIIKTQKPRLYRALGLVEFKARKKRQLNAWVLFALAKLFKKPPNL